MKHTFTLEYWQDDGWYVGKLQEIPGVFSQGETMEELEANIEDAYKMNPPRSKGRGINWMGVFLKAIGAIVEEFPDCLSQDTR